MVMAPRQEDQNLGCFTQVMQAMFPPTYAFCLRAPIAPNPSINACFPESNHVVKAINPKSHQCPQNGHHGQGRE